MSQIFRVALGAWLMLVCSRVGVAQVSSEIPEVAPAEVGMSADKLAFVDNAMKQLVKNKQIPGGVVIIARRGKIVMNKAWGEMDVEAGRPMETDTIMRCFSMTKAIVTAGALMLCDQGKLAVEDPVSKYLPELLDLQIARGDSTFAATKTMTIANLMTHTAGFSYENSQHQAYNKAFKRQNVLEFSLPLEQMQRKLAGLPVLFEPGTDWQYGISIDVLGRVIEVAAGMRVQSEDFGVKLTF